jgi:diaminohydroxyphosphoribosylaminopyrimidine deaminase/5-amino-6-(5-phosphoribosylamino)uracil reductase
MVTRSADERFMERALFLAERGRGRTSPNPMVGAVVVDRDGIVVGQGAHLRAGLAHAEVVALEAAGSRASGATLYCTLEPCCHVGRTGPCVERIVASGVTRVVAAMEDPNPRVSGRGLAYLRSHGVAVSTGHGARAARRLNAPFTTWIARHRPLVIVKVVVSADGFVGPRGRPRRLTGAVADRFFHRQRAEVDAVAAGSGTVMTDDPRLTARLVFRDRPLTRVVFDRRLRVPPTARLFSTLPDGPVIMVGLRREAEARPGHADALRAAGAELELLDSPDVTAALPRLADRGVLSLLVEGGPTLQQAFLAADAVDRVQWVRTPAVLGTGVPAPRLEVDAPPDVRETALGADVLVEWDVHGTD